MPKDPREDYYARRIAEDTDHYTDCDRSVCELGLNLAYTYDLFENIMSADLQQSGLSPSAFNLLKILLHQEEQCAQQNEIGELLLTSRANVTGLIDGLARKGLVERIPHPTDRRVKLARLLPAGRQLIDEVMPGHLRRLNESFKGISPDDRARLIDLLRQVRAHLHLPE